MPLIAIFGLLLLLSLVFGPGLWMNWVMRRHDAPRPDFPGTGGELARHLLDQGGLSDVKAESLPGMDHYDPESKAVRLAPEYFDGTSVTAVAVAAHEVGHALQDRDGYPPFKRRSDLVRSTLFVRRLGAAVIMASPLLAMVTHSPLVGFAGVAAGILTLALEVLIHLVTLPMEFDASFGRALPVLAQGGYLPPEDLPAARSVLRACAFTYVAGSLMSLLNLARWIRYLR